MGVLGWDSNPQPLFTSAYVISDTSHITAYVPFCYLTLMNPGRFRIAFSFSTKGVGINVLGTRHGVCCNISDYVVIHLAVPYRHCAHLMSYDDHWLCLIRAYMLHCVWQSWCPVHGRGERGLTVNEHLARGHWSEELTHSCRSSCSTTTWITHSGPFQQFQLIAGLRRGNPS